MLLRRHLLIQRYATLQKLNLSSETLKIPNRKALIKALKSGEEFDVLIIGGGCTGSGAALDATSRGLRVALVEQEDFASGTSSRSTKLIWGGSRYLVQALINLFHFDLRLLRSPKNTIQSFAADFKMVLNCHRERKFLLTKQPHLTSWLPIAVPLTKWVLWPPPYGYPPAALGPLGLYPLFFKFYDALSGFSSPPSHIMWPDRARRKFPQLDTHVKYCPIFYEGQHDDARTNLAIAQTAALQGAVTVNYCRVTGLIREKLVGQTGVRQEGNNSSSKKEITRRACGRVLGAKVLDSISGESFDVVAKSVLFCGGPFTDNLRGLEEEEEAGGNTEIDGKETEAGKGKEKEKGIYIQHMPQKRAVMGASGVHLVLPAYYSPSGIGLVDMSTSDGRFLFFLPWAGHVLVGTTGKLFVLFYLLFFQAGVFFNIDILCLFVYLFIYF